MVERQVVEEASGKWENTKECINSEYLSYIKIHPSTPKQLHTDFPSSILPDLTFLFSVLSRHSF